MTVATDPDSEPLADCVNRLAETNGVSGYTTISDGFVVYAAYDDGSYDLYIPDGQ